MNVTQKYPATYIQALIGEFVTEADFQDGDIILIVADGGYWLGSEILRRIPNIKTEVHFIKLKSYSGKVRNSIDIVYFPKLNLNGRRVFIIDDICDSGTTIKTIKDLVLDAKYISFITLLKRGSDPIKGLTSLIEDDSDDFFIGCGMDDEKGMYRNLNYIGVKN